MQNQLTVADIASIRTLIEAACARGAFRANEMTQVGSVYDKVSLFLEEAASRIQQDNPTQPQGEPHA